LEALNEITRYINLALSVLIIIKYLRVIRTRRVRVLVALFPIVLSVQIIIFFVAQSSKEVDPLLLNWLSQIIRLEALIYFLVV
jgi:hypothetical protein